jgi:two-component system NtrC family sensor kinase
MSEEPLVATLPERCRVCYTCVRECPAKAIRISGGQAEVIPERCIGCGNCVRVCSQRAKRVRSSEAVVTALLEGPTPVAACLAPSFPVEFIEVDPLRVVSALRALGFAAVHEVAFGADLVAGRYRRLLDENEGECAIGSTCPAIVEYVRRYHPERVGSLAPIVSPMIACARVVHALHPDMRIVFIGPCIAKKTEADDEDLRGDVDAVLTFVELRALLRSRAIEVADAPLGTFDPPLAGQGALLPIGRGLLQAANISEDLVQGDVVAAEGRTHFVEALRELAAGDLDAHLLEVLCCEGCIMGPGIGQSTPLYSRRARVSRWAKQQLDRLDLRAWRQAVARFEGLDLSRSFVPEDQRISDPSTAEIRAVLIRMGKEHPDDELNCGACGYSTCRAHAVAICEGLAESEMCLPYTIDELRRAVRDLARSNRQLARTRAALLHSEKLASMGQLAAGIAHEVNNPLGVVLLYAHVLLDELEETSALRTDVKTIAAEADRCKKIVAGLLNFARQQRVARQLVDVSSLVRSVSGRLPAPPDVMIRYCVELGNPRAEIDPDQISQVLTNLITNAYDAMPRGGTLTLSIRGDDEQVEIQAADTGIGIPPQNLPKVFEPFFTTKSMGRGTGLGLAVTYGIIKMHGGDIRVDSQSDPAQGPTGSVFTVTLPRCAPASEVDATLAVLPAEAGAAEAPWTT